LMGFSFIANSEKMKLYNRKVYYDAGLGSS
jgi:hypothetical protein